MYIFLFVFCFLLFICFFDFLIFCFLFMSQPLSWWVKREHDLVIIVVTCIVSLAQRNAGCFPAFIIERNPISSVPHLSGNLYLNRARYVLVALKLDFLWSLRALVKRSPQ